MTVTSLRDSSHYKICIWELTYLTREAISEPPPPLLMSAVAVTPSGDSPSSEPWAGKSRNAKAQARHRAKRKAYIEQVVISSSPIVYTTESHPLARANCLKTSDTASPLV